MKITEDMVETALITWFKNEVSWDKGMAPWSADQFRVEMRATLEAALSAIEPAGVGVETPSPSTHLRVQNFETPTPPGNQIRTAECDGKDAVPTGSCPVTGTASPQSHGAPVGWFEFDPNTGEFTGKWCSVKPHDPRDCRPLYGHPSPQPRASLTKEATHD